MTTPTTREVSFFVPGVPATKGSTKPVPIRDRTGRIVKIGTVANNRAKQDTWAGFVAQAAREAMYGHDAAPWTGPVAVGCQFVLPARARTTTAITNGVGDLDKLVRCVWDALTGVVFVDDVQVVAISEASKRIANAEVGEMSGCRVTVHRLDDGSGR